MIFLQRYFIIHSVFFYPMTSVAVEATEWQSSYLMDFYADDSLIPIK